MQLLAPVPLHDDQVGVFQKLKMLRHGLAGHRQPAAELRHRLPALLVQLPYIVVNPQQKVWRPEGISVDEWNQMFLPFAGLLFWWSAGRGFEAFLAVRHKMVYPRVTWLETIAAFVMFVGGTTSVVAIAAAPITERQQLVTGAIGFALWSALSIPMMVAKIQQIRLDRLADPYLDY